MKYKVRNTQQDTYLIHIRHQDNIKGDRVKLHYIDGSYIFGQKPYDSLLDKDFKLAINSIRKRYKETSKSNEDFITELEIPFELG